MKIRFVFYTLVILQLAPRLTSAQDTLPDTTILEELVVSAYLYNRPVREVPAPVSMIDNKALNRYSSQSLLPAINAVPGVRMEERSPGSYRLAIRGSSLRSPFGVRNVKVYWNDLPFTDAGGNTYFNLIDPSGIDQMEVLKGPGSSLYGAGTGGVLLLKNIYKPNSSIGAGLTLGSFRQTRYDLHAAITQQKVNMKFTYAHQQTDGYRKQSAMTRDVVQFTSENDVNDNTTLSVALFYTDLFYQTPGGLTLQQVQEGPTQANSAAAQQHTAIYNKTLYSGLVYEYRWNNHWTTRNCFYGSITQFKNSSIRNYERKAEQGFGGRTVTSYQQTKWKLNIGAEFQRMFSPVKTYDNLQGQSGQLITDDEISNTTYFVFTQLEFQLPHQFFLTTGASVNKFKAIFNRHNTIPFVSEARNFNGVFSPRVAILKKFNEQVSTFVSYSQGYSPPTVAELYPSTNVFDQMLKPEIGKNLEVGIKAAFFKNALSVDLAEYCFVLEDAIVLQRNPDGAEYFVNTGKTAQYGFEALLTWTPKFTPSFLDLKLWSSYTHAHYRFKNYTVIDADTKNDFSGNKLTGVAPNTLSAGIDLHLRTSFYLYCTYSYIDKIPLNDANAAFSNTTNLMSAKIGYQIKFNRVVFDLFAGADNLFNEIYSLGYDLNAPGAKFYNPAPTRNYYGGIKASLKLME